MESDLSKSRVKLNLSELHVACSKGDAQSVKTLLERVQVEATSKKSQRLSREIAATPDKEDIYLAAHLPIHTACQRREASREIVQVLLEKGSYSIADKTVTGDTALHVACTSGNLEAVEALLNTSEKTRVRECLRHSNKEGNTPLHLASRSGNPQITRVLLEHLLPSDRKQVISKPNKLGETSIGLAIRNSHWKSVMLLLKHSHNNPATLYRDFIQNFPECKLIENLQALEHDPINVFLVGDPESGKTTLINTLQHATLSTWSRWATSILGSRITAESCKVGIVPLTVEYRKQDHKCPFTFHDVCGCRDYAQEAIFTCLKKPLEALYIITVDVRRNVKESVLYWLTFLEHQLTAYRNRVLESPTEASKMKVKVAIAGTFCDLVSSSYLQMVSKIDFSSIADSNEALASQFIWCGNFYLNARKHCSFNVPQLLTKLHDQCVFRGHSEHNNESKSLLAQTYILVSLLLKEFSNTAVASFNDAIGVVQRTGNPLCKMLPKEDEEIEKLCHNLWLFSSFKVLTFDSPNRKVRRWYIIFDYKYLLKSVEVALSFLSPQANNGIVTRQQIKSAFTFRPDFIIQFLEHLKLCEYVSSEGLEYMRKSIRSSKRSLASIASSTFDLPMLVIQRPTQRQHRRSKSDSGTSEFNDITKDRGLSASAIIAMSTSNYISYVPDSPMQLEVNKAAFGKPSSKASTPISSRNSSRKSTASFREVPHYFFPSLIPKDCPQELWDEESTEYTYGFAWSLVPHEGDTWFLSPQFITIVLFRLLFSFAPHLPNPKSFVDRLCTLWDRGILWRDPLGARVCVAISDDNKVTLSMQCLQKYEVPCLSIRNEIMADIKQQMSEIHPDIRPRELFTPYDGVSIFPVIDPLKSYATFDKKEIWQAIIEKRPVVCSEGKHLKPLDSLLHFEPLCYLSPPLLKELFADENKQVQISEDFCMQLAKNLSTKWRYLADHFMDTVIKKYFIDSLTEDGTLRKAPHDTAMEMLIYLREVDYKEESERVDTYSGLQRSLFEISIFSPEEIIIVEDSVFSL